MEYFSVNEVAAKYTIRKHINFKKYNIWTKKESSHIGKKHLNGLPVHLCGIWAMHVGPQSKALTVRCQIGSPPNTANDDKLTAGLVCETE